MNKKILIGTLVLSLGIGAVGCSNKDINEKPNNNIEDNIENEITTSEIDFEVVSKPSDEIKEALNYIKSLRGYGIIKEDNDNYIIYIGSGEKPSGGYNIEVLSVEDIEGKIKISVKETSPGKDDMVSTALTYPLTLIKINSKTTNIEVVNTKGELFTDINDESGESIK